ncbi:hypothetical protein CHS0354_002968 [Potamilus streckersoni]|uniref:Uncharacterized protein n=1 Tax=Potamilus streckersoni TaxID=2493646 RepID=A0AAE0RSA0_9BIVA|nr:hypothetical protein CHS0354_002968 [Potamilus streckersoni]
MYEFQEKDLDYNWIPLYYSFVEPWDFELHLKQDNLKSVSNVKRSVHTARNESVSNDGVLRKYHKTRRGHAAGKRKRMQVLRRRGEKRLNVNAEVTDGPNRKRAKTDEDGNIWVTEEHDNMAAVLGGLNIFRQPETPEEEVSDCCDWERRGRGL